MGNILTIRQAVERAKSEGLPLSEYTLRAWIKGGAIPVRTAGHKALLYYPNLVRYLQCEDGGDNSPVEAVTAGIRRIEASYNTATLTSPPRACGGGKEKTHEHERTGSQGGPAARAAAHG